MNFLQRTFIVVLLVGVSSIRSENSLQSGEQVFDNFETSAVLTNNVKCD